MPDFDMEQELRRIQDERDALVAASRLEAERKWRNPPAPAPLSLIGQQHQAIDALGQKFVQWATANRIPKQVLYSREVTGWFGRVKRQPLFWGWRIARTSVGVSMFVDPDSRNPGPATVNASWSLVVSDSGSVAWAFDNPELSSPGVRVPPGPQTEIHDVFRQMAIFVQNHPGGSPWPR